MPLLPLHTQHSRAWQSNRYVYPVLSRRSKGLSIGVNLNPDKVCNFDCVYCCVDRTTRPTVRDVDLGVLRAELDHLLSLTTTGYLFAHPPFDQTPAHLRRINDIAFSGDGEPTSFQQFHQACQLAADLLEARRTSPPFSGVPQAPRPPSLPLSDTKIVVITNATLFHQPRVQQALAFLDQHNGEIWAKLDAGTEPYYRQIERTTIPLRRVLDNIRAAANIRPIVIQSLFLRLDNQGPPPAEIHAYTQHLKDLTAARAQIKLVQIYTVARTTAVAACTPLPPADLDAISDHVRQQTGLPVETYYGPS